MKRLYSVLVICLLSTAMVVGTNSLIASDGGGGEREVSGKVNLTGSSNEIPSPLVNYILQLAAPQFGVSPRWLIIQYNRGFVTVVEIGQNLYAVTYGGITIQILIESGSAYGHGPTQQRGPVLRY